MNTVVVMGGSFNPPTIAHMKIMQRAMESVRAEAGYFVPVSFPYLKRKMMRSGESHLCLSDELRVRMLEAMCEDDDRLHIFTDEMHKVFADTVGTMTTLQQKHPGARMYFVVGEDKTALLGEWTRKYDFLGKYGAIVFTRDNSSSGISSSRVREHLFDLEAVSDMLHPSIINMLKTLREEDFPREIVRFRDEYFFLAGSYPCEVVYEGVAYPCADSAFIASKSDDPAVREGISRMKPIVARQKAFYIPASPEWEEQRVSIMQEVTRLKFTQHHELMERLAATAPAVLINGVNKDKFWGMNLITWEGDNMLGKILMRLRREAE